MARRKGGATARRKKLLPPMPPQGPPFADLVDALTTNRASQMQVQWVANYGDLFTVASPLPLLIPTIVGIGDPSVAKELLIKQANQYHAPSSFRSRIPAFAQATQDSVGVGVTGLLGEEW